MENQPTCTAPSLRRTPATSSSDTRPRLGARCDPDAAGGPDGRPDARPETGPATEPDAGAEEPDAAVVHRDPGLSPREREVLVAWFHSESKTRVGRELFIAPGTVSTHLGRARAKYAAVGRPAATKSALLARAVQDGLLSIEEL